MGKPRKLWLYDQFGNEPKSRAIIDRLNSTRQGKRRLPYRRGRHPDLSSRMDMAQHALNIADDVVETRRLMKLLLLTNGVASLVILVMVKVIL